MVRIRDARSDDAEAITAITNALLDTTTYEWTTRPHTVAERVEWMERRLHAGHPVVVADDDGRVVGYASYGDYHDTARRPGYWPTVEHTIHVDERWWGRGIGRLLIDELVVRAQAGGKRVMVAAIDGENETSIFFHERLGFTEVGRLPGVGEKFGRWLDLVLMQRALVTDAGRIAPDQ
jgi:L-amino acid N-acyltransferase YncA